MSRTARLLDLIQILRRHRYPIQGRALAEELSISPRTLYRDIKTLQEQGAKIDGEPGVGYILRPGFMLPPLMFSEEEIEALVLGAKWVSKRTDHRLGAAGRNAIAKISAVLPQDLRETLDVPGLLIGPGDFVAAGDTELALIRQAIRKETKLTITYLTLKEQKSVRTIWPLALAFFDRVRVVVAWCELRQAFRHFRTDRILKLSLSNERYPKRRKVLLKEWRQVEGIPAP